MRQGMQSVCKMLGEGGCLLLSLIALCEDQFGFRGDTLDAVRTCIDAGLVHYDKNVPAGDNCGWVKSSIGVIRHLTNLDVAETRETIYGDSNNCREGCICEYTYMVNGKPRTHFTYGKLNPFDNENIYKVGKLCGIRHYKRV